jgi:hypothetical protein
MSLFYISICFVIIALILVMEVLKNYPLDLIDYHHIQVHYFTIFSIVYVFLIGYCMRESSDEEKFLFIRKICFVILIFKSNVNLNI